MEDSGVGYSVAKGFGEDVNLEDHDNKCCSVIRTRECSDDEV